MGPLDRAKVLPRAGELGGEALELFEVESGQRFQALGAVVGEMQPDDPMVVVVPGAGDQTGRVGPVDQPDGAVVAKEQIVGHLADGRAPRIAVTPDGQEQLMLGRRQARRLGPGCSLQRSKWRSPVRRASSRA